MGLYEMNNLSQQAHTITHTRHSLAAYKPPDPYPATARAQSTKDTFLLSPPKPWSHHVPGPQPRFACAPRHTTNPSRFVSGQSCCPCAGCC